MIERPKSNGKLQATGLIVSLLYILAAAVYLSKYWSTVVAMDPDKLATFAGGVFAPLAFLWLVLGFFQQGQELRHSADALWLQGEELKNSVEQQRQLVETQREAIAFERTQLEEQREEAKRRARPDLVFTGGGYSGTASGQWQVSLGLLNRGQPCMDLRLQVHDAVVNRPLFNSGESANFTVVVPPEVEPGRKVFIARFVDTLGNPGQQMIYLRAQQVRDSCVYAPVNPDDEEGE